MIASVLIADRTSIPPEASASVAPDHVWACCEKPKRLPSMSNACLQVGVIGGLGSMISPMAIHWRESQAIRAVTVFDRGTPGEARDGARAEWRQSRATLTRSIASTILPELDGVFICAGKNGDDAPIIGAVAEQFATLPRRSIRPFLCHMSTVSAGFPAVAQKVCAERGLDYVNYPLTGGPAGARAAKMLILASGEETLYERLRPALELLGVPRYFGHRVEAGAEVKLIGHLMVFNSLMGISSGIAVHSECFASGELGGAAQTRFFDFLNTGAGGARQWDLLMRNGVANGVWDQGFMLKHAAVDALYAAQLALEKGVSRIVVDSVLNVAFAFSFLLRTSDQELATHAVVRELLATRAKEFDRFLEQHGALAAPGHERLKRCEGSFPERFRTVVALDVREQNFITSA